MAVFDFKFVSWHRGMAVDRKYGSIYLAASKTSCLFAKHSSAFIETCFGQISSCEVLESTWKIFSSKDFLCAITLQIEAVKLKNMVKEHNSLYNCSLSTPSRANIAEQIPLYLIHDEKQYRSKPEICSSLFCHFQLNILKRYTAGVHHSALLACFCHKW